MKTYLYTVVQAHEEDHGPSIASVQGRATPLMVESISYEPYLWNSLDRQLLDQTGHVDKHRLRLKYEYGGYGYPIPDNATLVEGAEPDTVTILDGPRAGEVLNVPYSQRRGVARTPVIGGVAEYRIFRLPLDVSVGVHVETYPNPAIPAFTGKING